MTGKLTLLLLTEEAFEGTASTRATERAHRAAVSGHGALSCM